MMTGFSSNWDSDWALHPGSVLEEMRQEKNISPHDLAGETGLTVGELYEIEAGEADIDELLAERLGDIFGTGKQLWLNLQSLYEEDCSRINQKQSK